MTLIDLLNLPTDQLFTNFFLPFILIFAILWGLFSMISIFNRKINIILAIGITLLVANTEYFVLLSTTVFQYSGFAGVVVFGVVLIFGIIRWGFSRGEDIYDVSGHSRRKFEKLAKDKAKHVKKLAQARDRGDTAAVQAESEIIKKIDDEMKVEAAEG